MRKNIITISRQFASGGHEIGKMVADKLGIDFYDKEIISIVAKKSGYSVEFVEETGELVSHSLLFNIAAGSMFGSQGFNGELPIGDKVYVAQYNVIQDIAKKGPCVIVGRGADYILRERDDCFNAFIHADMAFRKNLALKSDAYSISEKNIEKEILKRDKRRAAHYNHYTSNVWGASENYDITLNSASIGIERCADAIVSLVK